MSGMEGAWLGDPLKFLGRGGEEAAGPPLAGGRRSRARGGSAAAAGAAGAAGTRTVPGSGGRPGGSRGSARWVRAGIGAGVTAGPSRGCHVLPLGVPPRPRAPSRSGRRRGRSGQCWGWGRLRSPGSVLGAPSAASRPRGSPEAVPHGARCPGPLPAGSARRPWRRTKVLPQ